MTPQNLSSDARELLEELPAAGVENNNTLRDRLGWEENEDRLFEARSELVEKGFAESAHGGRGGGTKMKADLSEDARSLLEALPRDGEAKRNPELREELGWEDEEEERFWEAREELIVFGLADSKRGGPGGATYFLLSIDELNEDCQALYQELPEDGSPVGNIKMRRELGWEDEEERYWEARDRLQKYDFVETARGHGGSTYRVEPKQTGEITSEETEEIPASDESSEEIDGELDLYDDLEESLETWAKDQNFSDFWIDNTAHAGSTFTGGKWTRPDLTVVRLKDFDYLPGRSLEVITFEVKHSPDGEWGWNIDGLFETLAHARSAHQSFLLAERPEDEHIDDRRMERMVEEARRVDVGLIMFDDPSDYSTFESKYEPEVKSPSERLLNEFIEKQVSDNIQKELKAQYE